MPVTRASSRQTSQQPGGCPYSTRRADTSNTGGSKKAPNPLSNDIIILSSDDDEPPPKGTSQPKKTLSRTARKKAAAAPLSGDVLEISSDEESKPKKTTARRKGKPLETTRKDLELVNNKLQEELKQYQQLLASSLRELEELKRDFPNKDVLVGLEEHTFCEVCALTMWCPYTLPECGHSFCENCLLDWFSTTQAQHMTTNPQLDGNRAALAGQLQALVQLVPNLHAYGVHGQHHLCAVLTELRRHQPEYTCPSCRKPVINKPVEDFRLKALITQIAELSGEMNHPRKDNGPHHGSGLFDHFFVAPVLAR